MFIQTPWFFAVFAAFVITVVVVSIIMTRKRREKFAAFAASRGLHYEQRNDQYTELPWGRPFGVGYARHADYVLTGTLQGRPVLCFDYRYTESSGSGDNRSSTTYHFSIFAVAVPRPLPGLQVSREGIGGAIARAFGFRDIELESDAFNRKFSVQSDVRKFAYDVLHPRMMDWMLETDAPGFRIVGNNFVVINSGSLKLQSIDGRFAYLNSVIDQVPNFVWSA